MSDDPKNELIGKLLKAYEEWQEVGGGPVYDFCHERVRGVDDVMDNLPAIIDLLTGMFEKIEPT